MLCRVGAERGRDCRSEPEAGTRAWDGFAASAAGGGVDDQALDGEVFAPDVGQDVAVDAVADRERDGDVRALSDLDYDLMSPSNEGAPSLASVTAFSCSTSVARAI